MRADKGNRPLRARGARTAGVLTICFFLAFPFKGFGAAADSLEFASFAKKLRGIFSEKKISSVLSCLPENAKVYGYDVGDYSGDQALDLVMSVKTDENIRKELTVYFFLNNGDAFTLVETALRPYVAEPIEIGFSVDAGVCHVTRKLGEFHWAIAGYAVRDGVFMEVDKWETRRLLSGREYSGTGVETADDFRTLRSTTTYFRASDSRRILQSAYFTIPAFPAWKKIPDDIVTMAGDSTYRMVKEGGSSWSGPEDCSLYISARYDTSSLVIATVVYDDHLVIAPDLRRSDYVCVSLDLSGKERVDAGGKIRADSTDLLHLYFSMGDGRDRQGTMTIRHSIKSRQKQNMLRACSQTMRRRDYASYEVLTVIPRDLFGESPQELLSSFHEDAPIGCTVSYHDVDVPDKPEWVTLLASSDAFNPAKPATYGVLKFFPSDQVLYERDDLRTKPLLERMSRAGLVH